MKYSMIAVSALGFLWGVCSAEEPPEAKTEASESSETVELTSNEQKVNYSLGFDLGKDLKGQDLPVIPEALLRGVEDGRSGARPLVDARLRQAALKDIRAKRAADNLQQSQAFLTANADKEGVQTLPSGLQYKEIQAGEGKTPGANDTVVVHYRGSLIDGTQWVSTYEGGKPNTHRIKELIKGLREGVQLMKEGAKWELFIPPELGYGERGREKRIPPNSVLIFEVELISVKQG